MKTKTDKKIIFPFYPPPPAFHFILEGCGTADLYYSDYVTLHFLSTALIFI